ncbi:MAG: cation:proton antiporter regulatory subunit [Proteobacteria bacterium]|nr:cation:proton antiporter regulatory subunit [Pseudomonadota bacterium]
MSTRETDLPGIGTKHTIDLASDEELVVVAHRSGQWELARTDAGGDTTTLLHLQAEEGAELGRILSRGEVPESDPHRQLLLDEFSLEWVPVGGGSSLAGATLREADIRARTGASVIAVLRGRESILNPPPETSFAGGDTLVVMGHRDQVERFLETFCPPETG